MKQLPFMLAIIKVLAMTQKSILGMAAASHVSSSHASSTPSMPRSKNYHRHRAHAPNDGHWHMKFHRSKA